MKDRNILYAGGAFEVEVHPGVHAPLAEVAVVDTPVAVVVEDLLEVAQIGAELVGVHGGVLPVALGIHVPGGSAVADGALAHLPRADVLGLVEEQPRVDLRPNRPSASSAARASSVAASGLSWPNSM